MEAHMNKIGILRNSQSGWSNKRRCVWNEFPSCSIYLILNSMFINLTTNTITNKFDIVQVIVLMVFVGQRLMKSIGIKLP